MEDIGKPLEQLLTMGQKNLEKSSRTYQIFNEKVLNNNKQRNQRREHKFLTIKTETLKNEHLHSSHGLYRKAVY